MMLMNFTQLEILIAIVDEGSLTKAADSINLTQSAVSHALAKLEAELGVKLLERNRQGIQLTQIGEEILQDARTILAHAEIIHQKTARERGINVGKIRFGCVPTIPPRFLSGMLRDFQNRFPEIEIVVFEGHAEELVTWLNNHVIDVATVINPHEFPNTLEFARNEIKIIVSKENELSNMKSVSLTDVFKLPFIGPKSEYISLEKIPIFKDKSFPKPKHAVSSHSTILAMVQENLGFSLLPEMLFDQATDGIAILDPIPKIELSVYLASHTKSPAIDTFMKSCNTWAKAQNIFK